MEALRYAIPENRGNMNKTRYESDDSCFRTLREFRYVDSEHSFKYTGVFLPLSDSLSLRPEKSESKPA